MLKSIRAAQGADQREDSKYSAANRNESESKGKKLEAFALL